MTAPAFATHLRSILLRDLRALRRELDAYPDDASVWATPAGISNSCGTLVLHLCGNLRTYVGREIGGIPYERDRPKEFATRNAAREALRAELDIAMDVVERATHAITSEMLAREVLLEGKAYFNAQELLMHIAVHLTYHLGQVDYHRRLTTANPATVATIASTELSSIRPVAS